MAVDFDQTYRSTTAYKIRPFNNMGQELIQVSNEYGMVAAILSESDFKSQFEVVPEEPPASPVGETGTP